MTGLIPELNLFQNEKRYILILIYVLFCIILLVGESLEVFYAHPGPLTTRGVVFAPLSSLCPHSETPKSPTWQREKEMAGHLQAFVASKSTSKWAIVCGWHADLRSLGHTVGEHRKWSPPSLLLFQWGRCWKISSLLDCREPHRQTILLSSSWTPGRTPHHCLKFQPSIKNLE